MQQMNENNFLTQPSAPAIPAGTPPSQPPHRIRTAAVIALIVLLTVVFGTGLFAGWVFSLRSSGSSQSGSTPTATNPTVTVSGNMLDAIREAAVKKVNPSVVQVNVVTASGKGLGSGVILDSRGFIVTNNHVIAGAERIQVTLYNGTPLAAQLVGTDKQNDLAVIKISTTAKLTVATLGDSSKLQVGQLIQTEPLKLTVRLAIKEMGEELVIWETLRGRLASYFAEQGIADVVIEKAPDQPQLHPKSGKFQQVWSEVKQQESATLAEL